LLPVLTLIGFIATCNCGVKVKQLPVIEHPYVSEMEFLKEVKNVNGKAKKKRFKQERVTSPFYFLLKIKEIENSGEVTVVFYSNTTAEKENEQAKNDVPPMQKAVEKRFNYGQPGKYYEYIIFFDRVDSLQPGTHRYAVFINGHLLYEDRVHVFLQE
jgi:hypothetical protein